MNNHSRLVGRCEAWSNVWRGDKRSGEVTEEMDKRTSQILEGVFDRTEMYVPKAEFFLVVEFLSGYDTCCNKLDLRDGFTHWLMARLDNRISGLGWPHLVLHLQPGFDSIGNVTLFPGREREYIQGLRNLLFEYLDERENSNSDKG